MNMDLNEKNKNKFKNKTFCSSLKYAISGFRYVFAEERNMRKHVSLALLAILAGFLFQLNGMEWLWLLLAIFIVIVMEIVNTTIENLVDLITDYQYHPLAKKVKDMAASAVLFSAFFAVVIGVILFLPKIISIVMNWLL